MCIRDSSDAYQLFMRHSAEQLETDQRSFRTFLLYHVYHLRRSLHVDDEIVYIRTDLVAGKIGFVCRILGASYPVPVSYTHLDVYKRQLNVLFSIFF